MRREPLPFLALVGALIFTLFIAAWLLAAEVENPPQLTLSGLIEARTTVARELNETFMRFKKLEMAYQQLSAEIERRQKAGETAN